MYLRGCSFLSTAEAKPLPIWKATSNKHQFRGKQSCYRCVWWAGTTQNFLQSPSSGKGADVPLWPLQTLQQGERRDRQEGNPVCGTAVKLLHRGSKNHAKPLSHKFSSLLCWQNMLSSWKHSNIVGYRQKYCGTTFKALFPYGCISYSTGILRQRFLGVVFV